jgi:F-type H+-transporting ATPase subunit b
MTSQVKVSRRRLFAAGTVLAMVLGLFAASALAQDPNPNAGLPAGHPPLDTPPPVRRLDTNQVRPGGMPNLPPGGRPGMPGAGRPAQQVHAVAHDEHEEGGHAGGHCPGHGPDDAPHFDQINWWHGLIGVNNEKAVSANPVDKLLWRYHNPTNPCDEKNEEAPLFAALLNLAVLGYIVYHFGRKPISAALLKRKQDIMSEIETASRLEREAQRRLDDLEEKFDQIQETLDSLKIEYAAQGEVDKKHIVAEAEERRARMRRDAEFRVEQELRATRIALMQEAVANATSSAEEIIRKRTAQADVDRMSEEYLSSLRAAIVGSGGKAQLGGKQ